MEAIYHAFQHWMLCACLAGLGMIAALVFLAKVAAPAWDAVRRWWSLPCIQRVIVGVCVVGLSYFGATKQGWHVAYDGGIKAGATANVVTNDTVSIHWQRDTSDGVYVPESAAVYIDYRPNTETNAEWGLLAQTTVGAWGWSGTVENATNYDYNVWAYYIPPEPVHTNGVWTYKTHFDRNGEYALPLRARVEVNGVAIATPAAKRRDLPYDSEVEYLESTGTQWIDTGIYASEKVEARIDFQELARRTGTGIFGTFGVNQNRTFYLYQGGNSVWQFGCGPYSNTGKSTDTNRHHAVISNGKLMLDGVLIGSVNVQPFTTERTLLLFNMWRADGTKYADNPRRIYSFCLVDVNTQRTIIDFTPVRIGTTGAMYDKRGVGGMNSDGTARNDGLYFNRGTGNFGYGNDK